MNQKKMAIGVFDSGVGGLGVLKKLIEIMPSEKYVYMGDFENAPYGIKTEEEIRSLSLECAKVLVDTGVKAIVVACNTATTYAIDSIREKYPKLIVVGTEPSVNKIDSSRGNSIVFTTKATLNNKKMLKLIEEKSGENSIAVIPMSRFVEFVENRNEYTEQDIHTYIHGELIKYNIQTKNVKNIVLGCTHFPFIKNEIASFFNNEVEFYDGAQGVAMRVKDLLEKSKLLVVGDEQKGVKFINGTSHNELMYLASEVRIL